MRWRRLLPFVVLLTLAGSFAGSAPAVGASAGPSIAGGGPFIVWIGWTDQHFPVFFTLARENGGAVVHEMELDLRLRCPVSHTHIDVNANFTGFDVPIEDNAFSFVFNDGTFYAKWVGEFDSPIHAVGSQAGAMAHLTPDVQAELCASGRHGWHAHPATVSGAAGAAFAPTMRISFTKDAAGRVHRTVEG